MIQTNFNIIDSEGNTVHSKINISPVNPPSSYSGSIIADNTIILNTLETTASLVPNIYDVKVTGFNGGTRFYISLPTSSDNTSVNAANYIISGPVPYPNFTASYANFAGTASYAFNIPASDLSGYTTIGSFNSYTSSNNILVNDLIASSSHYLTTASYPDITDIGGNVGINNTNPQYTLDVSGRIANSIGDLIIQAGIDSETPGLGVPADLFLNASCGGHDVYIGDAGKIYLGGGGTTVDCSLGNIYNIGAYKLTDGDSNSYVGCSGGYVGIGMTTPFYELDVNGDIGNSLTNDYYIGTNGNNSYLNSNGGYVGIGMTTPFYELDVNGDINFTGNLYYNGGQNWISSDGDGNTYFNTSLGNGGIVAQSDSSVQAFIQVISTTQHVALVTDPLVNGEYSFGIYDFNYGGLVIGCLPNGNASVPNNLGVGTSTPDYTLDVNGTTHSSNGYQLPDYTTISSPAEGLLAYNFTTHHTTVYNGTTWI